MHFFNSDRKVITYTTIGGTIRTIPALKISTNILKSTLYVVSYVINEYRKYFYKNTDDFYYFNMNVNYALRSYYAESSGYLLPTFRDRRKSIILI